jgi:hypothetical protein
MAMENVVSKAPSSTDFKKAAEICRGWERAAASGRAGTLTEIKVRKVLEEIYERTHGEEVRFETVGCATASNKARGNLFGFPSNCR